MARARVRAIMARVPNPNPDPSKLSYPPCLQDDHHRARLRGWVHDGVHGWVHGGVQIRVHDGVHGHKERLWLRQLGVRGYILASGPVCGVAYKGNEHPSPSDDRPGLLWGSGVLRVR